MSGIPNNFVETEFDSRRPEEREGHVKFGGLEGRQAAPVDKKQQGHGFDNSVQPHPIINQSVAASVNPKNVSEAADKNENSRENASRPENAPAHNPTYAAQKQAALAASAPLPTPAAK